MFEQTFKNIDDVLWKEAGCTTELDYTEQTSWILFLKYLDDLAHERALQADLHGKPYSFIIDPPHRWSKWAAPKTKDGTFKVIKPKIGDRIYDGACGSAGFLCESYDYLRAKKELSTSDLKQLQERTFYGKEKKSLAYVIGIMNMILHGIDAPNIEHTNTLAVNIYDIQDKDRYDVILANPPFGGKERAEVQRILRLKAGRPPFFFFSISSNR